MTQDEMIEYANQLTCKGSAIVDAILERDEDLARAGGLSEQVQSEIAAAHEAALTEALNREVTPETAAAAITARQADQ